MAGRAGYHTVGKIKKIQEENKGKIIFHFIIDTVGVPKSTLVSQ